MDFGDVWLALGIDLELVQGAVTHLYKVDPEFQVIDKPGAYHLELVVPKIEARPECGDKPYRIGIHLLGTLTVGDPPVDLLFDAWVRLAPALSPEPMASREAPSRSSRWRASSAGAKSELAKQFEPTDRSARSWPSSSSMCSALLDSATRVIHPPDKPEDPVTVDPAEFAFDFWPAQPATIRRPVYGIDDNNDPFLDLDISYVTNPALVATVALAGTSPRMVGDPSVVRPGTGLQLVTTKAMFDARLAVESAATVGTETEGVTVDRLDLEAVDGGIAVDGAGHKTGATLTFEGTVIRAMEAARMADSSWALLSTPTWTPSGGSTCSL